MNWEQLSFSCYFSNECMSVRKGHDAHFHCIPSVWFRLIMQQQCTNKLLSEALKSKKDQNKSLAELSCTGKKWEAIPCLWTALFLNWGNCKDGHLFAVPCRNFTPRYLHVNIEKALRPELSPLCCSSLVPRMVGSCYIAAMMKTNNFWRELRLGFWDCEETRICVSSNSFCHSWLATNLRL